MDRVERFLAEVVLRGGESLLETIKIAALLIAKVFTICFMGFLMASKYVNILPANGRKLLNGIIGVLAIAAMLDILSTWRSHYLSETPSMVGAIVLYTYVFHMLAPPPEGTFDVGDVNHHIKSPSHPTGSSAEQVPLLTAEAAPAGPSVSKKAMIKDFFKFLYQKLKLKQIIQPAIIASIIAIIIGCVPMLRRLVFTSDAPLYFFTDSFELNIVMPLLLITRDAMILCILLALGGNLVDGPGPGSAKLGLKTTAAIIFGRLVLVPPTELGIVTLSDKLGFLPPGDKMFRFVLLLQHTMPHLYFLVLLPT
ncbi:hypothetical protein K7X08_016073 [Anisodus acutangulus]|uniref:PIN-like protein n=1 Tax=Anisodus acutangulus TaxID=402998 RepID=A0A9Q1QZP3_9SOLA|nr:hypothetical protein K7X08_016073 [Anisodus acutangulus]